MPVVKNDDATSGEASHLHSKILHKTPKCPVNAQREWWRKTGPLLASLMTSAGYTNQSQYQYLMFFYRSVVPYLGPYPQIYRSAMTHNELPLELSINFQQLGGSKPVIRVAVEPVTSLSGTEEDPYNMSPIHDYLSHLENINVEGYDDRVFKHFYPKHTLDKAECQKLQDQNEAIRERSQAAFGFDLKPNGISVKGYTFPGVKCHALDTDLCSVAIGSVQEYLGDADRYGTLNMIKDYVKTTDEKVNFGFVYSNDCIAPEKSRHKLYGRTKDMSWSKVRDIWSLGGRINSPESDNGLEYLQRLWKVLQIGDDTHPLGVHLVYNYEMKAGLPVPATKIYFPVYGLNDQSNVRAIAQYLTEIGLNAYGNAYEQSVRDSLKQIAFFAGYHSPIRRRRGYT
ncbi:unnamed protein product [Penicillium pancosmium]